MQWPLQQTIALKASEGGLILYSTRRSSFSTAAAHSAHTRWPELIYKQPAVVSEDLAPATNTVPRAIHGPVSTLKRAPGILRSKVRAPCTAQGRSHLVAPVARLLRCIPTHRMHCCSRHGLTNCISKITPAAVRNGRAHAALDLRLRERSEVLPHTENRGTISLTKLRRAQGIRDDQAL